MEMSGGSDLPDVGRHGRIWTAGRASSSILQWPPIRGLRNTGDARQSMPLLRRSLSQQERDVGRLQSFKACLCPLGNTFPTTYFACVDRDAHVTPNPLS